MQVTHARNKSDFHEIADLKGKVFKRASYYDFYEERMRLQTLDPWFKPEHAMIVREEGRIVSQVTLFERPVRIGPAVVKMGGIGDVFTVPRYRGKGYSKILMDSAFEYMKGNEYDFTLLFGIPDYYHKFGYIEAMKYYQMEMLDPRLVPGDQDYQTHEFSAADLPAMLQLYKENIKDCILVIDRTVQYLNSKALNPAHVAIITDSARQLAGYAFTWDPINSRFAVIEAVSRDRSASIALLTEICRRQPVPGHAISIKMSPQMPFVRHLRFFGTELKTRCFAEGEGKGMLSVIDLCRMVNKLKPLIDERLAGSRFYHFTGKLQIKSAQSVELFFEKGVLRRCSPLRGESAAAPGLTADFRYLGRNIVGYWSMQDLLEQTDARVFDEESFELLNVLFPKREPFLLPLDYF